MAPLAGLRPQERRRRSALVVVTAAVVMALVSPSSFASEPKLRTSALRRISAGRAIDPSYFERGARPRSWPSVPEVSTPVAMLGYSGGAVRHRGLRSGPDPTNAPHLDIVGPG